MIDHHVDRPDVDDQQWAELTGTNRSIGLINHKTPSHVATKPDPKDTPKVHTASPMTHPSVSLDDLAAIARGNTPDPIPNSAVKTLCANGTAS